MVGTTIQIRVDKKSWAELKTLIAQLINPRFIEPSELSDSQTSQYILKVLNEFVKINKKQIGETDQDEKVKVGFSREF